MNEIDVALVDLMAPDGYYKYLGIPKAAVEPTLHFSDNNETEPLNAKSANADLIKKNYRKLSRKHHPDRPGGNVDTFRMLNRAHKVLLNDKLRQQYDILGIDLDDDELDQDNDDDTDSVNDEADGDVAAAAKDADSKAQKAKRKQPKQDKSHTIVQEIASTVLAAIMHVIVRTVIMGCVACLVVRYRLLFYPAFLFILYVIVRSIMPPRALMAEIMSPTMIAIGLLVMHNGRTRDENLWTIWFWMGEAAVLASFIFNSVSDQLPRNWMTMSALAVVSLVATLWFRGSVWNYAMTIGLESFLALIVALAFPVFEFILETILNEKLKKVGDKVRAHHAVLEKHYEAKLAQTRNDSSTKPKK
ncbi:hypothetical protein MPSEU_000934400 [Mayamaea pseudoterrestris]|nr:hypothetical protein MPSEU_000934400 [Mayamaea pseudoterrestris]